MASKPRPQPNPLVNLANAYTNEFLQETADETNSRITNLIARNANLGGDVRGYTFANTIYSQDPSAHEKNSFIPEIEPALVKDAEALFMRAARLQAMRTKLQQALSTIFGRCGQDMQIIRDSMPDAFVQLTSLDVYPRHRPQGFMLKAAPTLAASYRVIDEALIYRLRYRLLD